MAKRRRSPQSTSAIMKKIRSKNTKPEILVRKLAHKLGYRFRLHRADLPGKPDIVFPGKKKALFVHGCFWHQHQKINCRASRLPRSNTSYWLPKLARNAERDVMAVAALKKLGWTSITLWECELHNEQVLTAKIKSFLGKRRKVRKI